MIPEKKNKTFIRGTKGVDMIAFLMEKYLTKWNMPSDKAKEYAEKYWDALAEKVKSGEVRIILPHNLGYIQGLQHQYTQKSKAHLLKFGNLDYSVVWIRHPMFVHHRIEASKKLNNELKENRLKGIKFLTDYVDGDTYAA